MLVHIFPVIEYTYYYERKGVTKVGKRELIQTLSIIFFFTMYLVGKNYLPDATERLNFGLLVPLSSIGFFIIAFTITTNLTRNDMNQIDKIISIAIFILLLLFGLAIYIEFFFIQIFSSPLLLPALAVVGLIAFLVIAKNELSTGQHEKQMEHTES